MSSDISSEVAVIGGGPAGAIAALALARLGRNVVLCEAADFPREHIGISLSPGTRKQLAFLDLECLLDRPDHRTAIPVERRWTSATFETAEGVTAIVADRGVLDADLIEAARQQGVRVLQPASVRSFERTDNNMWRLNVRTPAAEMSIESAFVVEAAGRHTRFRKRQRSGPATMAVFGKWLGPPAEAMRISALDTAWCWGAPTGSNSSVLACFADPGEFRRGLGSVLDHYLRLAQDSGALSRIETLTLVGALYACDATPYMTEGETAGLLRVGDADIALDPLSSSGVQAAIQSALAAGPIVNTLLTPGGDHESALEFWRRRRASRMMQHRLWASRLYQEAFEFHSTGFWGDRCEAAADTSPPPTPAQPPDPDQPICLSEDASLLLAPCLTGNLVKRLECVSHSSLPEPVAFVAGVHLPPLLRRALQPLPARELVAGWSNLIAPGLAYALLGWAWRHAILRGVAGEGRPRRDIVDAAMVSAAAPALKDPAVRPKRRRSRRRRDAGCASARNGCARVMHGIGIANSALNAIGHT